MGVSALRAGLFSGNLIELFYLYSTTSGINQAEKTQIQNNRIYTKNYNAITWKIVYSMGEKDYIY